MARVAIGSTRTQESHLKVLYAPEFVASSETASWLGSDPALGFIKDGADGLAQHRASTLRRSKNNKMPKFAVSKLWGLPQDCDHTSTSLRSKNNQKPIFAASNWYAETV
eukprot:TRINITY_DN44940_c0_g1_i1.p1 TRINITY_DN44940_c0_g1~~TRINITY_DN44940_c0_g1_i1.p1  ORF type:complete len:124 (-),score=9.58 TRINITY_DN44940_c0_g1_i1:106-432(-)